MKLLKIEKEAKATVIYHDTDYINIEYIVTINAEKNGRGSKIRVKGAVDTWILDVRTPEELAKEIEQMLIYTR
jgi:uroporphyrinogen-III decarboxylase